MGKLTHEKGALVSDNLTVGIEPFRELLTCGMQENLALMAPEPMAAWLV